MWINGNEALIAQEKFESFLHKTVGIAKNCNQKVIYWFEGFNLKKPIISYKEDPKEIKRKDHIQVDILKNEAILPTWLQQRIFEKHAAQYAPDHERYEKNLDLSDDELKIYLGTYFPRSFGECFCVFDNIFDNKQYAFLATKEEINILDIGSGTGGNLMGLLIAINKYSIATKKVNIIAIDGHLNALRVLNDIVDCFRSISNFAISLSVEIQTIHSVKDIEQFVGSEYDFIMCFKMGCELIADGEIDFYYDLASLCLPKLSKSGLLFLLDVTTKVGITYNPILMNLQINRVIKELMRFKTLIPIACGEFEKECVIQCFTQRIFYISHSLKMKDKSKVAYRILANADFVKQISLFENNCSYVNIFEPGKKLENYCPNNQGEQIKDNYRI